MRKTVESAHYIDKMQSNMNTFGRSRIVQSAIVLFMMFSWIAISNHCAFGAVASKSEPSQSECPFHSKPAKQKEQSTQVQCCKILRAVVFAQSNAWARDDAKFRDTNFSAETGGFLA